MMKQDFHIKCIADVDVAMIENAVQIVQVVIWGPPVVKSWYFNNSDLAYLSFCSLF